MQFIVFSFIFQSFNPIFFLEKKFFGSKKLLKHKWSPVIKVFELGPICLDLKELTIVLFNFFSTYF